MIRTSCSASLIKILSLAMLFMAAAPARTQEVQAEQTEKMQWFGDARLGIFMHWGPYSRWGIVESWSICAGDEPWCRRKDDNYTEYKQAYENLGTTFNSIRFAPEKRAKTPCT